ncbi:MAG: BON domain-containing protein [Salinisphaeraceae bacterium]|nr:BON domain-containing protein [Salinisphaeraceae bacterium]
MFKIAIWISILLMVMSLVLIAPMMNPALAADSADQDSERGGDEIVIAANTISAKDEIIATRIDAAFLSEPRLKPYYIEVAVNHGIVTLKGQVASEKDWQLAVLIASEQDYVREVRSRIEVEQSGLIKASNVVMDPHGSAHSSADDSPDYSIPDDMVVTADKTENEGLGSKLDNASLATKVKTRLLIHFGFSGLGIDVDAEDQVVHLSGTVDSPEMANQVGQVVATTPGVRVVRNEIKVEAPTSST